MKKKKVVIGLDIDTTKIGFAIVDHKSGKLLFSSKIVPNKDKKFFERTFDLVNQVNKIIIDCKNKYKILSVGIEDYGSFFIQRTMAQKGEVTGIVKWLLINLNINIFEYDIDKKKKGKTFHERLMISPTKLKKFIYGKGNVSKSGKSSELKLIFYKDTGIEGLSDDEIDAYYIGIFVSTVLKYNGIKYDESFEIKFGSNCAKLTKSKFESFSEILKVKQ